VALPQENLGTSLTTKCSIYYQNYDLFNLWPLDGSGEITLVPFQVWQSN
jgi:hypothetical protein